MVPGITEVPAWSLFACGVVFGTAGFLLGQHAALHNQLEAFRRQERRLLRESDDE